ncbi:MinD-like ATPase involved in chromosome partitioning or flagellar assembly [Georgenia soli]|uniref:MinD-like ATPase involved in chromosome partitioning or flagellar assembly n=1 Tax=Georgenia soli TaxID=638953 RepID=A0A2A9F1J7_9MICO|nr:hypothetical protein [Georgenia soli]PFG45038.1 MinD-like ATPase involved in chromosome partitioning or flagellar assembly [Georgenia soli]
MSSDLFAGARRAEQFIEPDEELRPSELGAVERAALEGTSPAAPAEAADRQISPAPEVDEAVPAPVVGMVGAARSELIRPGATERVRAQWGWRKLLGLRPGPVEQAHLDAERVIRQATWRRAVNVLVANKTGGVGKTTASLVLAGVLGRVRGGSVAAFEVADATGALEKRGEGTPVRGLGELVQTAGRVASSGELAGYAAPQTSLAHVIGSVADRPVLTGEDVRAVRTVLDRYYRVTVADSGNNPHSEAFTAAVGTADVLVIPTLLSSVSVLDALDVLENVSRMGEHGRKLAETAVVVINHDGRPEDKDTAQRARRQLVRVQEQSPGVSLVEVPFDGHVSKGGEITLASLSANSGRAWTQVAATVTRKLLDNV